MRHIRITVQDRIQLKDGDWSTIVSMRDGALEYGAEEIGLPGGGIVKVYRSPATIANVAMAMRDLPIVEGHIDQSEDLDWEKVEGEDRFYGRISESRMIDLADENGSTVAVQNLCHIKDACRSFWGARKADGAQFSLGYSATLIPVQREDGCTYEQRDIAPHHLAVVDAARCGPACTFIDSAFIDNSKEDTMLKLEMLQKFADDKGVLSFADATLEELMLLIEALPSAIGKMDATQLPKVQKMIMALAAAAGVEAAPKAEEPAGEEPMDESSEDMDPAEMEQEAADRKRELADAREDAAQKAVAEATRVIDRAREFLAADYAYAGKGVREIMRDCIEAVKPGAKISDENLGVAFELLEKRPVADGSSNYRSFGAGAVSKGVFSDHFNKNKEG